MKGDVSRRETLLRCAAAGALKLAPWLGIEEVVYTLVAQERNAARRPTQWNEIGPFYKRLAPNRAQLRTASDAGLPLLVSGAVYSASGNALPEASIEIWHADHQGVYDLDGYRFRCKLSTGSEPRYSFSTVLPGHYPARVCQHIHYLVTVPGHKPLITQLYFATDPVFEGDPNHNYSRDPQVLSPELVRPVTLDGEATAIQANVTFNLVLEQL